MAIQMTNWIFVDESGQSGGVSTSRRAQRVKSLNFKDGLFVDAAIVVQEGRELDSLEKSYGEFKRRFSCLLQPGETEIKGTDLATRRFNEALEFLVGNVLGDVCAYVNVYDKKFYLATLLLGQVSPEMHSSSPEIFYRQATFLSKQEDTFFVRYCDFVEGSGEHQEEYLDYLMSYPYLNEPSFNALTEIISVDRSHGFETINKSNLLSPGAYNADKKMVNLINLNCLAELLVMIKERESLGNACLSVIHDEIVGIDRVIADELEAFGVRIMFESSKSCLLLQLADNLASLFAHFLNRTMRELKNGVAWKEDSRWDLEMLSNLFDVIGRDHVKLTVPIDDLSVYRALVNIFDKGMRTMGAIELQSLLNRLAQEYCFEIIDSLAFASKSHLDDAMKTLRE